MKTILVVEDDENLQSIIVEYLKKEGYQIIKANDGLIPLSV